MTRQRHLDELDQQGWTILDHDDDLQRWVDHARPIAETVMHDPQHAEWWRSGGTWFVGVNALPNDATGRIPGGPALTGRVFDLIAGEAGPVEWDRAQVSVVRPGYPVQADESDTAFGFRLRRDGAHLDGLKRRPGGTDRFLGEYHRFLLGLPVVTADPGASPLVAWRGSHLILREMVVQALAGRAPGDWVDVDFTEIYARTRRRIFDTCERVQIHARPGQAFLLHRHVLHGISPWQHGATAPAVGRMVIYFRPSTSDQSRWLSASPLV